MEAIQIEKNKNILVVAVLGRKDEDVYENRIIYAIDIIKNSINDYKKVHLLAKDYGNKWTFSIIKKMVLEIKSNKIKFYKSEEETKFYRNGKYSYDTIEEAAMLRLCIEKLFKNEKINLIVVTSELHSKRSDWIFNSFYNCLDEKEIFESKIIPINLSYDYIYISPSKNSEIEKKDDIVAKEQAIFNKQMEEFSKFINFLDFYKDRKVTFGEVFVDGKKGERDDEGKKELIDFLSNIAQSS